MKPTVPALVVVTATGNLAEALPRLAKWQALAAFEWPLVIIENGGQTALRPGDGTFIIDRSKEWLGSVPAIVRGLEVVRQTCKRAEVIAVIHDDVEIDQPDWDVAVLDHFARYPNCGSAGFSGAHGLGAGDIYQVPYAPMQLARQGFLSNLREAEAHGKRSLRTERVACHDGFSLIGRACWWLHGERGVRGQRRPNDQPWDVLADLGMRHHAYDGALGVLAAQAGWESWYLPIACHHLGGRTAVANASYSEWARTQIPGGDQGFWEQAHAALYELGRGTLPLRVY